MGAALREAWFWLILAFLLGLAVGWLARARSTSDVTRTAAAPAPAPAPAATPAESVADAQAPATRAAAAVAAPVATVPAPAAKAPATRRPSTPKAATATKAPATKAPAAPKAATATKAPAAPKASAARKPSTPKPAPVLDLAAAKAILGVTVKLDDHKLIEGIGPKIESLLKADGLATWRDVSKANVERLQGILDAAGPRYSVHNPGSWPTQAGLLADGKFAEFKKLTESLKGGK